MFLNAIHERCIRVLLDPVDYFIYVMVPRGEDPTIRLSRDKLKQLFPSFFPDDGMGNERRPTAIAEVGLDDLPPRLQVDEDEEREVGVDDLPPPRMGGNQVDEIPSPRTGDHDQQTCLICLEPFAPDRRQVCLPCDEGGGNLTRHCQMCEHCLEYLLAEHAQSDSDAIVKCPICRHEYPIQMLQDALDFGCLEYPAGPPPVHMLRRWHGGERPLKRTCMRDLSRGSHPFEDQTTFEYKALLKQQMNPPQQLARGVEMVVTPSNYFQRLDTVVQSRRPGYTLRKTKYAPITGIIDHRVDSECAARGAHPHGRASVNGRLDHFPSIGCPAIDGFGIDPPPSGRMYRTY